MAKLEIRPPFIAGQRVRLLRRIDDPRRFLRPGFFRIRRVQASDHPEPPSGPESAWEPVDRDHLVTALVRARDPKRLVIAAQAGMGMSTFLKWLHFRANAPGSSSLAFILKAADLPPDPRDVIVSSLVPRLRQAAGNEPQSLQAVDAEKLLTRLRHHGRLILLLDDLHEIPDKDSVALRSLLGVVNGDEWQACPIVLGTRFEAIERLWEPLFKGGTTDAWRFATLMGFNEEERRRYLGTARFGSIPEEARPLFAIPRLSSRYRSLGIQEGIARSLYSDYYAFANANLVSTYESDQLAPHPARDLPPNHLVRPDALDRLLGLLLGGDGASGVVGTRVSIVGMPGIGKTVLAQAAAQDWEVRYAYPDGIFWFDIGQEPRLAEVLGELVRLLGMPEPHVDRSGRAADAVVDQLTRWINAHLHRNRKSCLVILDDVDDPGQILAFGTLNVLVTSRNRMGGVVPSENSIELEPMSDDQALRLLAGWSEWELRSLPPVAPRVVRRLGNLPLAVAMVGAMARGGQSEIWDDLDVKLAQDDMSGIGSDDLRLHYESGCRLVDVMRLCVDGLEPRARARYLELAVFPAGSRIPPLALQTYWRARDLDPVEVNRVVNLLVDRSMVQRDSDGWIRLHDVQHSYLRQRAGNLTRFHHELLNAYRDRRGDDGWAGVPDDGYFFQNLPYHLAQAGELAELSRTLLRFGWLAKKLEATNIQGVLADFDLIHPANRTGARGAFLHRLRPGEFFRRRALKQVLGALQLSSHVLAVDKSQLAGQLLGRLLGSKKPSIRSFLAAIRPGEFVVWLRPLNPCLTPPGGELVRTFSEHATGAKSVAVSRDGRMVVSASAGRTMWVSYSETGTSRPLAGLVEGIRAVAISASGRVAAAGSNDGYVRVWDLTNGDAFFDLRGHAGGIRSIVMSDDGLTILSSSDDRTVRVWVCDREGGRIRVKEGSTLTADAGSASALAVSRDGRVVVSGSDRGVVWFWDLTDGGAPLALEGHQGRVNAVAVSEDGRVIVSGSDDNHVRIWEPRKRTGSLLMEHGAKVNAVAVSRDGHVVVSGSDDRTVRSWDLKRAIQGRYTKHSARVNAVALSENGRIAISGSDDQRIGVWFLERGTERILAGHESRVNAVVVSGDGRIAISGSDDGTVRMWDLSRGIRHAVASHRGTVNAVAVSGNGRIVVSGSDDETVGFWDVQAGKGPVFSPNHGGRVKAVAVGGDGRVAVSGSDDGKVGIWKPDRGRVSGGALCGHKGSVNAVAVSVDGRLAVSGADDGTVGVWELKSEAGEVLEGHSGRVNAVAVSMDGRLAISGSDDQTVGVWDLASLTGQLHRGHSGRINAVAVSGDARTAVTGSDDCTIGVWDLERKDGRVLAGHLGRVTAVAVSKNGRVAVSGSDDRTVRVWDPIAGVSHVLTGHGRRVNAVAVSGDGRLAISASDDRTVRVWDLESHRTIAAFSGDSRLLTSCLHQESPLVVVGDQLGRVYLLRLEGMRTRSRPAAKSTVVARGETGDV